MNLSEKILFSKKEIKLGVLSKFVTEYCQKTFSLNDKQVRTVYSGVNLEKYKIIQSPREELFNELKENYKELENLSDNELSKLIQPEPTQTSL